MTARVLVAGGLEPTGRAGLLADVAMAQSLGAHPVGVASALTAQGETTFTWRPVPSALLESQVRAALELGPLHALKLGQVPDRATLRAFQRALAGVSIPWVVDPVVASSRGGALTRLSPRDYLRLAAPHVVLTPNLDEAAWLLGWKPLASVADAEEAGRVLVSLGFGAAVVKGGHQPRGAVDVVVSQAGVERLAGARVRGGRVGQKRGKGCRFASALAVGLGRGEGVVEAAERAKAAVAAYLRGA